MYLYCIFLAQMLHSNSNMVEAAYTPRYGFYGIYQPRNFVAQLINPIETFTSVYNLYIR